MTGEPRFREIQAVAFDLDGVIYLGESLVNHAANVLKSLEEFHIPCFFITNNSTRTRKDIAAKLGRLGIVVKESSIYSSAWLAGKFILKHYPGAIPLVRVVGSSGLIRELTADGIRIARDQEPCEVLLVGYDPAFDYPALVRGFSAVAGGSQFIACNLERSYPIGNGQWMPGCAGMVGAIAASAGRDPDHIVGKPNTFMLELILQETGLKPEQILVVGDTPDSDIMMANRFGSPSVLLVPHAAGATTSPADGCGYKPTACIRDLTELLPLLNV